MYITFFKINQKKTRDEYIINLIFIYLDKKVLSLIKREIIYRVLQAKKKIYFRLLFTAAGVFFR
jgi:hypothetical protein